MKNIGKSFLYIVMLLSVLMVMCSCGSKSKDDSTDDESGVSYDVNIPCMKLGAHILASQVKAEELTKTGFSVYSFGDNACIRLLTNYAGFDADTFATLEDAFIYMPDEATADEIIIAKTNDVKKAADCLEAHRKSRMEDFYGYFPEEADKLENISIIKKGPYVAMLVGTDSSKYNTAFEEAFDAGYEFSVEDENILKILNEKNGKTDMFAGKDEATVTDAEIGTKTDTEVTAEDDTENTTEQSTITTETIEENVEDKKDTETITEIKTEEDTTEAIDNRDDETISTQQVTQESENTSEDKATGDNISNENDSNNNDSNGDTSNKNTTLDKLLEEARNNKAKNKKQFLNKWNKIYTNAGVDDYDQTILDGVSTEIWKTDNGVLVLEDYQAFMVHDVSDIVEAYKTGNDKLLKRKSDKLVLEFCKDFVNCYISDDMTAYEKELTIFDFLLLWTKYDDTDLYYGDWFKLYSNEPYGCLIKKTGICNGFSATFKLLLNIVDVDCEAIFGYVKSNWVYHSWNKVKLSDNNWYDVDITWCIARDKDYFNRSDSYFYQTEHYEEGYNIPYAEGGKFEGYPKDRNQLP